MKFPHICVIGFASLVWAATAPAQGQTQGRTLGAIFSDGNEAFFRGDFEKAITRYEELVESGVRDPDVYFNLATAYARNQDLGHAILYFERASRLDPSDDDLRAQLSQVRDALAMRAAKRSGEAIVRVRPPIREALVTGFSADALAITVLVLECLCLLSWLARRAVRRDTLRLTALLTFVLSGVLAVTAAAAWTVKVGLWEVGQPAIVINEDVLREGPDPKAQGRGEVDPGTLARVLLQEGNYVQVDVVDGQRGWLPRDAVGLVDPD